jgi:outer membrane protein assembly factor BamB
VTHSVFAGRLLGACLLLGSLVGWIRADNWPQWRGPQGDGLSKEKTFPTRWSKTQNVAWTLPMPGQGGSTPIVWGERVFLTSGDKNDDLWLLCLSTAGKELWKRKLGNVHIRTFGNEGNGASASPSTDGKHVWAFVGSGDFACFDFAGNEVWKFNAQDRYGKFKIQFGMHSTPVLYGDRLYMQLIHSAGAWVIAVDKNNGETVWKVARKSDGRRENEHSYASPVIWRKGDKAYLITHGNDYAIAHRLDNGEEIWRVGDLNPKDKYRDDLRFVASPLATADLIVVPSAKRHAVVAIKPDAAGFIRTGSEYELWRDPTGTPDVPSPLLYDGRVYLCGEDGILTCRDAKSGKRFYSESTHRAKYRASPVCADGNIYLTALDGTFSVVKAGAKFELLATNRLPDTFAASPALADGRIYLRGFSTLYAIEQSK